MAKLKGGTRVYGDLLVDGALDFSAVTLTTPIVGEFEFDGTTFIAAPSASFGRGTIPVTSYTSGIGTAGITGSTNFALFPVPNDTITLPIGTYFVKMRVRVAVTGSTTAGTMAINLRGAGSASGSFSWGGTGATLDSSDAFSFIVPATSIGINVVVTPSTALNPRQYIALGEGILKITAAGSIIPSYQYSTTLSGGTTTLVADNYMTIQTLDTQSAAAAGPSGSGWV